MIELATDRPNFWTAVKDLALGKRTKSSIPAATTLDEAWGGTLSKLPGGREFITLIERKAVLMQAPFTRVPFARPVAVQVGRPLGYKVVVGEPKPATNFGTVMVRLEPAVVGSLLVLSTELLNTAGGDSEAELSRQLSSAVISAANTALLDPNAAGSLTDGITPVMFTGTTDADLLDALVTLLAVGDAPVVIASLPWAVRIVAALHGAERLFPLLVAPEAGDKIIAVDPRGVVVAMGGVDVSQSESATLQMRDDPAGGPTNLVSMYQTDSVAVRAQLYANWERVRDNAVAVLNTGAES